MRIEQNLWLFSGSPFWYRQISSPLILIHVKASCNRSPVIRFWIFENINFAWVWFVASNPYVSIPSKTGTQVHTKNTTIQYINFQTVSSHYQSLLILSLSVVAPYPVPPYNSLTLTNTYQSPSSCRCLHTRRNTLRNTYRHTQGQPEDSQPKDAC